VAGPAVSILGGRAFFHTMANDNNLMIGNLSALWNNLFFPSRLDSLRRSSHRHVDNAPLDKTGWEIRVCISEEVNEASYWQAIR
jgi:hypothetical protein